VNYYKRHIGDYLKDTAHLSLLEHGIYSRLLDVYYTRESAIPDAQTARLIGARSKDELAALRSVLDEFFVLEDGTWSQSRCDKEIGLKEEKAETNRENGKRGGRPKKETQSVSENNPDGFKSEPTNNPSHKPVTNNHNTPVAPKGADGLFERFWASYPNKSGHKAALKAWEKLKLIPNDPRIEEMRSGLAHAKKSREWLKDNGEYIPHASTWLNGERWKDELHEMPQTNGVALDVYRPSTGCVQ